MVKIRILGGCQEGHTVFQSGIHIADQRHMTGRSGLKMMVVRSRCTALGAIVEKDIARVLPCHIQHIHISVPYGLVHMPVHGYHKMIREYRIGIHKYMVSLALAAIKLHHYLLRRAILPAKEASTPGNILLVQFSRGRYHACRIELEPDHKPAYLHFTDAHILQCPEIVTCERPA